MHAILQRLNNFSVSLKIGVIFSIPLLMMGYMAIEHLLYEIDQLEKGEAYIEMVELVQLLDDVAHNTAIERGLSSGFIGDQNEARRLPLQKQRTLVDQKQGALSDYLQKNSSYNFISPLQGEINQLQALLTRMDTIRIRIDHGGRSEILIADIFDYYSRINSLTLNMIRGLKEQVTHLPLIDQFNTLLNLLWIKERAGQERGRLNHYFSSGLLSNKALVEINHYIHEQHLKLNDFHSDATPRQRILFQSQVRGPAVDYVINVRNTFLSRLKKQEALRNLNNMVGMGGELHRFKNYRFRKGDPEYQEFTRHSERIIDLLFHYRKMEGVDRYEQDRIHTIEEMVNHYSRAVEVTLATGDRRLLTQLEVTSSIEALDQLAKYNSVAPLTWFKHASERINRIDQVVEQIDDNLRTIVNNHLQEINQEFTLYQSFILALVATMLIALYYWKRLLNDIHTTVSTIHQIEHHGDLSLRIAVTSRDEIGQIGAALNSLFSSQQQAIRDAIHVSAAVAEGEFDQRIQHHYRGDMEALREGINGSADQVEYYTHAKDEFLASMSHELRTPLTTIIGNCELLTERQQQQEDREILHSIELAGRTQLALVNDILDMSKIESGKFTIDKAPFDLALLLKDLEHMLSVRAQDAGLEFTIEQTNPESHLLLGDATRISQILINLVGNAIKFTEHGAVTLSTHVQRNYLLFKVQDSGIGMSPDTIDHLFERFEQTDSSISRRFGGSGLGLYISENLAQLMDGNIDCSSREGEGSLFTLILPYQQSDIKVSDPSSNEQPDSTPSQKLSGKVLIAEDTPELQLLERRMLELMGLNVTAANNGEEAVAQLQRHHFDLVLMDMQMPIMDGIEATRTLRKLGHTLPVIALTANVMQKHRDAFEQAGCDGFVEKPINREKLRKILTQHLAPSSTTGSVMSEVDDELTAIFMESNRARRTAMQQAIEKLEWNIIRETAHALKGSSSSFGYPQLSQNAEALQQAIDNQQYEQATDAVEVVLADLDQLLD